MGRYCCAEFDREVEAAALQWLEGGGAWALRAADGFVLPEVSFCPFCGRKLFPPGQKPGLAQAAPERVEGLAQRLTRTFREFVENEALGDRGLSELQALLGCHYFYTGAIRDVQRRTGNELVGPAALESLRQALEGSLSGVRPEDHHGPEK